MLRLLAANQAGELVKARIARGANISEGSVTAYVDLLEMIYLSESVTPWTPNLTSREAGRSKVVVRDSGLAARLSRVTGEQLRSLTSSHVGALLEGFVVDELLKQRGWSAEEFELVNYRTRDGLEVDAVAEFHDGLVVGIEVKASSTHRAEQFAGLRALRDKLGDRFIGRFVLGTSNRALPFGDRLWGLPVSALWEL